MQLCRELKTEEKEMKASRKLERFMRKNRPAGFPVKQESALVAMREHLRWHSDAGVRGTPWVVYEDEPKREGVYYTPSLRWWSRHPQLQTQKEQDWRVARDMGYTEVIFVPWDAPVVVLPVPPWVESRDYVLTLCYQSEVAKLTGPFIKYLTDLAKGKVS